MLDAGADLVLFGMGEHQIVEVAEAIRKWYSYRRNYTFIRGSVYKTKQQDRAFDAIHLPDYNDVVQSKKRNLQKVL